MLFIQKIDLVYTKAVRYGNYANVRRSVKFLPVNFDTKSITDEILFNSVDLLQRTDGLHEKWNKVKIYGENAFYTGKFNSDFFGQRIFVKRANNGYEILYTDKKQRGYVKSKFTLTNGQSGRIIYNERYSNWDCPWLYYLTTFNFVCAEKSAFKPKIFFRKMPDFTFNDMKKLWYNGYGT